MAEQMEWMIEPLGDRALLILVEQMPERSAIAHVRMLYDRLQAEPEAEWLELVPALASIAIYYDPLAVSYAECRDKLRARLQKLPRAAAIRGEIKRIPLCYGGDYGPDLDHVAEQAQLTVEEAVRFHSDTEYVVGMIGFVPGFPYLMGLPKALAIPRRDVPRLSVPAGSVGIGGNQTGIYPFSVPGGWQIVGRTPLRLFQADGEPPCLLMPGDTVKFVPIEREEFVRMEREDQ